MKKLTTLWVCTIRNTTLAMICCLPAICLAANLTRNSSVAYQYVDASNNPVAGQFKDMSRILTDGKDRIKPITVNSGQVRVLFDLGRQVMLDGVRVTGKSDDKASFDTVQVFTGDAPDQLTKVAERSVTMEESGKGWLTFSVPVASQQAAFVRVDIARTGGGRISISEIRMDGEYVKGSSASSDANSIMSAEDILREQAKTDAFASGDPLKMLTASLNGVTILTGDLDEKTVRDKIGEGQPGDVFYIEPGSSWTLSDTLNIPEGITIIGTNPGGGKGNTATFIKGFDGPLAEITRFVTLYGIRFDGNRQHYKGDGIVCGGHFNEGVREVIMTRVEIANNEGNAYVMNVPHYFCEFVLCTFSRNGGYGLVYGQVRSHHTDNMWRSCHISMNGKGGVAFYGMEASSVWENCEFFYNGGPAFDHFLIHKKTGHGKPIGPRPEAGADVLIVRNSVIRNNAGPVWLQRVGRSQAIVFEDSRLKHNGQPKRSKVLNDTEHSSKTAAEYLGLTEPVGGLFHVEEGRLNVELRGAFAWNNTEYMFTASPHSMEGSSITISGGNRAGGVKGSIHAPNGYAVILDTRLLEEDASVNVKSGIGLDPLSGQVINFSEQAETRLAVAD